jgi:hypothetical protein
MCGFLNFFQFRIRDVPGRYSWCLRSHTLCGMCLHEIPGDGNKSLYLVFVGVIFFSAS